MKAGKAIILAVLLLTVSFSLILYGCRRKTNLPSDTKEITGAGEDTQGITGAPEDNDESSDIAAANEKISEIPADGNGQVDLAARLEEFLTAYKENSSYPYSGTVLVAKGDKILLCEGCGMADYGKNTANEPDSVFAIGSLTKSFTAVAIMQLQEQGLLKVSDPISKYIDGNDRGDDITIHQLLTHTSGLPRDGLYLGKQQVTLDQEVDYINKCALLSEPGKEHSYSNAGYILLAAIIEKVSGKSYNDYIRDNIFAPLGMDQSRGGTDASYAENQSVGYRITTGAPEQLSIYSFSSITGCGNLYSTVFDMFQYSRGISDGKLLSKDSWDAIFYPQWGDWITGYGYGWGVSEKYGCKRFNHKGNIGGGGYYSSIIRYPEEDFVLIFLSNNEDPTAFNEVSAAMEAIIFGRDYKIPQKN